MLVSALILFVIYGINEKNIGFVVAYEVASIIVLLTFILPAQFEKSINQRMAKRKNINNNTYKNKFKDADIVTSAVIIIFGIHLLSNVAENVVEKCMEIVNNPEILNISMKDLYGILALAMPYMLPFLIVYSNFGTFIMKNYRKYIIMKNTK